MRRTLTALLSLSLLASPALAGTPSKPEIPDDTGDVDVQHLVDLGLFEDETIPRDKAETIGDITRAWVHTETADSFQVSIELAEIPDQENTSAPLMEAWVHWTINDEDPRYHAQAVLVSPQPDAPLQANYKLYEGSSQIAELPGSVDTQNDTIRFSVSKATIGDVAEGDAFTQAYVTTHLPVSQATVDYAPGARSENVPASQQDLSSVDPTSLSLAPSPEFGSDYDFQDFQAPEGDLDVSVTPSSLEVEAGEKGKVSVRVVNNAEEADAAQLSVGTTPSGWSATTESSTLDVPSGEDRRTFLFISPAEDAEGLEFVDLTVSSSFSGEVTKTIAVTATQPADTGTSDGDTSTDDSAPSDSGDGASSGDGAASGSDGSSPSTSEGGSEGTNDSPALGPIALLGVVGAVALALRRRKH